MPVSTLNVIYLKRTTNKFCAYLPLPQPLECLFSQHKYIRPCNRKDRLLWKSKIHYSAFHICRESTKKKVVCVYLCLLRQSEQLNTLKRHARQSLPCLTIQSQRI